MDIKAPDVCRPKSKVRWVWLLIIAVAVALTALLAALNRPFRPDEGCCDHLFYRSMAFNLFTVTRPELNTPPQGNQLSRVYESPYFSQFMDPANRLNRQPPYVYRPVAPLVARVIARLLFSDDINRGFYALALLGLAGACALTACTVYLLSQSILAAVAASAVFSAMRVTRFSVYDFMLTDPLAFFLVALGVLFMLQRRTKAFLLVCFVCAFTKEVGLFLLPCYLLRDFLESRTFNRRVAAWGAAIVGALLAFRASVHIPMNTYSPTTTFTGRVGLVNIMPALLYVFSILLVFSLRWGVLSLCAEPATARVGSCAHMLLCERLRADGRVRLPLRDHRGLRSKGRETRHEISFLRGPHCRIPSPRPWPVEVLCANRRDVTYRGVGRGSDRRRGHFQSLGRATERSDTWFLCGRAV